MVVVYIILFILFLLILVMIHELGHLLTAKMFNVYCFEFAVGFGPKIVSFKRKQGETRFSIRAIPFGGFVSMYGESDSVPEELQGKIDPNRSILAIKKWKRAIVMVAGVVMNFILAIVMFFIYEVAFPSYIPRYGHVMIDNNSIASEVGLKTGDFFYSTVGVNNDKEIVYYDSNALLTYSDNSEESIYFGYSFSEATFKDTSLARLAIAYSAIDIDSVVDTYVREVTVQEIRDGTLDKNTNYLISGYLYASTGLQDQEEHLALFISDKYSDDLENCVVLNVALNTENKKTIYNIPQGQKVTIVAQVGDDLPTKVGTFKQMNIVGNNYQYRVPDYEKGTLLTSTNEKTPTKLSFKANLIEEESHAFIGEKTFNLELSKTDSGYKIPSNMGISMLIQTEAHEFGDAVGNTFVDFGNSASIIFRSLGSLFTDASAWSQVGGIVAIGVSTSKTLEDFGFGTYLYFWALISVNLGIINLFPFPGLDGWHLFVIAVEGITRKEIPSKVKSIISFIGVALLFVLMVAILIKDVVGLFL